VADTFDTTNEGENIVFELDRASIAKHERAQRESSSLKGRLDALSAREAELTDDVGKAKARIDPKGEIKPKVDEVMEDLQKRAHDRSVGAFERMLTGITDDVLPDYKGQRSVKLDLSTKGNMPALEIYIDHMGNREEITSGAVANVVSTGLRFIALARSGARPLLVLDEADCWIDGIAVQNYFNVVNQLSRDAGIQTVVITHHDLSAFSEDFRIYRITDVQSQDSIPARNMDMVSPGRMEKSEINENPLSFISVKNVEGYPDAAIELSPGVTVISGANQRGKSSWARMLRAAFMAEGGDSVIRHGHNTGEIAVGFADGRVLEYQRNRKTGAKAEFAMHSPESWSERLNGVTLKDMRNEVANVRPLHHTVGAKLPEWVSAETGVYPIDDINVQLWGQFTPVFMLDASPSARASLLSIGRESGYLYAMSETFKDDVRADNTKVREGEKEIAVIRAVTKTMESLPGVMERLDALKEESVAINEQAKEIREIGEIAKQLSDLCERCNLLDQQAQALRHLVDIPQIEPTERMGAWLTDLKRASADAAIQITSTLPAVPVVEETQLAQNILEGLAQASQAKAAGLNLPALPEIPEVSSTTEMQAILMGLSQAQEAQALGANMPSLPEIPQILETSEVQVILSGLSQASKDAQKILKEAVPELPAIQDTSEIASLLQSLKAAAQGMLTHQQQLKSIEAEMAQAEKELREATDVLGNECPVCHSVMTVEMLLGKDGHDHGHDHAHAHAHAHAQTSTPVQAEPQAFAEVPAAVAAENAATDVVVTERARKAAEVATEAPPAAPAAPSRLKFRR
jgi:AAA domain